MHEYAAEKPRSFPEEVPQGPARESPYKWTAVKAKMGGQSVAVDIEKVAKELTRERLEDLTQWSETESAPQGWTYRQVSDDQ